MKKTDTYTYTEACEDLRNAVMAFNTKSYNTAFDMLESLAYYVVSERAKSTVKSEDLLPLRKEVARALGQFTFCGNECLWEKASQLSYLFRDND